MGEAVSQPAPTTHAPHTHPRPRVAVIGFGYAGAAAALTLAQAGIEVQAFEAARTLGGRARRAKVGVFEVDNGQHIALGAYTDLLAAMKMAGVSPTAAFLRLPLQLSMVGGMRMRAPAWLPLPLSASVALLSASGLSLADKWAACRFFVTQWRRKFTLPADTPVAQLMVETAQPANLVRNLWEPLCIAALNTPMAHASAQVYLNVLRDSFMGGLWSADMLIPQVDLSALLPDAAARTVESSGGSVALGQAIRSVTADGNAWRLDVVEATFDAVIIATAPQHAAALLPNAQPTDNPHASTAPIARLKASLEQLAYESITTLYLRYAPSVRLPRPMTGFINAMSQWVFDRGHLGGKPGDIAVVISASARALDLGKEALAQKVTDEVGAAFAIRDKPTQIEVVTEKRATFRASPNRPVPEQPAVPGLWLAGDYMYPHYPATLEGAVRSGFAAADAAIKCCNAKS
jgi:hydroxysqualene dehydroxylase